VICVLMRWPDVTFPRSWILGFNSIGEMQDTHVFRKVKRRETMSNAELLRRSRERRLQMVARPGKLEGSVHNLWACNKDMTKGFAGPRVTMEYLDEKYGPGGYADVPRFDHVEGNGKRRAFDNGFAGGQNEATGHTETIDLCSGLQPAIQTKALA
jgi:hypothetical protein